MNIYELTFGLLLIVVLLGLSGYYSWRQWLTWKRAHTAPDLDEQDRQFLRAQAWRRWIGCGLMVLFAGCLAGTWFMEGRYQELVNDPDSSAEVVGEPEHDEADKNFARFYTCYWVFTMIIFLMIVAVAGFDARAVLHEGVRKHRELRDSEKAKLEEEIRNYRKGSNGHF